MPSLHDNSNLRGQYFSAVPINNRDNTHKSFGLTDGDRIPCSELIDTIDGQSK
jgi:hypothetical protein